MAAGWWARSRRSSAGVFQPRPKPPCSPAGGSLAHSSRRTRRATPKPRRSKRRWASTGLTRSTAKTCKPESPEMDGEDGDPLWDVAGQVGHWLDRYVADLEPGSVRVLLMVASYVLYAYAPLDLVALVSWALLIWLVPRGYRDRDETLQLHYENQRLREIAQT